MFITYNNITHPLFYLFYFLYLGLVNHAIMNYKFVLLFLSTVFCLYGRAQLPILRNFSTLDYSGSTQNWGVSQYVDARMFFGNNSGLLSFDGDKWSVFPVSNFTNVRSVYCDNTQRKIYVGATDELGYFYGKDTSLPLQYHSLLKLLPLKERAFGEIWKIYQLPAALVFQAKDRVIILHRKTNKVSVFYISHVIENSSVIGDKLYISCKEAVYVYRNGLLKTLHGVKPLLGKSIRGVVPYKNSLLFVTDTDGLYLYDGRKTEPWISDVSQALKKGIVYCAAAHKQYLAFGTVRSGLIVKNLENGLNYYANTLTGLQNNTVLSMSFDHSDNIWLGLDNGIAYVMLNIPFRNLFGINNNIGTGYASVVFGRKLYLGTNQGLFYVSYPLQNVGSPPSTQRVSGISGQIWGLCDIQGTLLCGANDGAFIVDGNRVNRIQGLEGTWGFIPLMNHPGYVLACDYKGLVLLKKDGNKFILQNRFASLDVSSSGFLQDIDGSIWISHWQRGIFHLWLSTDLKKITRVEYFHKGNGLLIDDNNLICKVGGRVYVSSADGFRTYNHVTHKLMKNERLNKVFNTYGVALRVRETSTGDLWAYKPGFLAIAHRCKNGGYQMKKFPYMNMVRQLQMSLGHIGFPDNNHTLMNYENGYYIVENYFNGTHRSGSVMIRSIFSTNNRDTLLYENNAGKSLKQVAIPHHQNSLRIEFALPEYRDRKGVEYACYLENYDSRWSERMFKTTKEYTHLPKGRYVFHVMAHDIITGANSESKISVQILPAWYETWVAYLSYAILMACIFYLFLTYVKRRAERKLRRVKRENEWQLKEQQSQFEIEREKKETELVKLRNEQLEIGIRHKTSQLSDSTINLVRKNDILKQIDFDMEDLSERVRREEAKAKVMAKINEIRHGIKNNMSDDDNWKKFEENFNLVYNNFSKKMMSKYPDLNKGDLKLCIYLRMGLSSKEMASLLNTSVRSIETARYRLRKKLGIESGDSLMDFIQVVDNSNS